MNDRARQMTQQLLDNQKLVTDAVIAQGDLAAEQMKSLLDANRRAFTQQRELADKLVKSSVDALFPAPAAH